MSGETEKDVSAWTIDSLHSHFIELRKDDRDRLDDLRKDDQVAIAAALAASKEAIAAALASNDKRLELLQHFQQALKDQESRIVSREYVDAKFEAIAKLIDGHRTELTTIELQQVRAAEQHVNHTDLEAALKPLTSRLDAGATSFAQIRLELAKNDTKDNTVDEIRRTSSMFLRWLAIAAVSVAGVVIAAIGLLTRH